MKVAAVVKPKKLSDPADARAAVVQGCAAHDHELIGWLHITPDQDGTALAQHALEAGADLVIAAGGDGTVRAVADALAHTDVALGILPTGTGNLLARNLGLPLKFGPALGIALTGARRRLDVGNLRTTDPTRSSRFLVMTGIGFDEEVMDDTSSALKARLGWAAYALSAIRHLRDNPMQCTISVDNGAPRHRRARAVLIGNVSDFQGGLALLPDARPDDGYLDLAVLAPRNPLDWVRVLARGLRRSTTSDHRLERTRGRRIEVRTTEPQPFEYDGNDHGTLRRLVVEVDPQAVTVMVPR